MHTLHFLMAADEASPQSTFEQEFLLVVLRSARLASQNI